MYEKYYELPVAAGEQFPVLLNDKVACAPFEEYLGMKIEIAEPGTTKLSMPFNVKLAQSKGFVHGGAIASLAHTALAVALKKQLPVGSDIEILTFSLRFYQPVTGGTITAVGKILEEGDKDIRGEALVYNSKGDKAASYSAVYRKDRARKLT